MFPFLSLPKSSEVNHQRKLKTLINPEKAPEASTPQTLLTSPYLPFVCPICSPPDSLSLETYAPSPVACHFPIKAFVLWLKCYISPSSNHPVQLLFTAYSPVYAPCVTHFRVFLSCYLSFVRLIYRPRGNAPKVGGEKRAIFPSLQELRGQWLLEEWGREGSIIPGGGSGALSPDYEVESPGRF